MTFRHPFGAERLMGAVHAVDGSSARVTLPRAADHVAHAYGERLALGAIGEFVVIDIGGMGVFGRLLEVDTPRRDLVAVTPEQTREEVGASGSVQLLCTLEMDGTYTRGLKRHPRVGDQVYSASDDVVAAIMSGVTTAEDPEDVSIEVGTLAVGDNVPVRISASKLFGRHLAVVGSTGAGKSWTVARLIEEVAGAGGRLLLIDATGEYRTLGSLAKHLTLTSTPENAASGEEVVALPHYDFTEADRNAFLRPSAGAQLPKLRIAIRSLRLARALGPESDLVDAEGLIRKCERPRRPIQDAERNHAAVMENPHAPFSLDALPGQIRQECVFETPQTPNGNYGGWAQSELAYCNSLIARVLDLLQTDVVRRVVAPRDDVASVLAEMQTWLSADAEPVLRISLQDLVFSHFLREISVNTLGRRLLALARSGAFAERPLIVVVDEAHQFFGQTIGDEFSSSSMDAFDAIAKEGRKYGLTICMATQRPGDLPTGVLSQVGMLVVHRLADKKDREKVEQASSEIDYAATRLLPTLVPGEGLLIGADFPVPVPVRVTAPQCRPHSRGPNYGAWRSTQHPVTTSPPPQ